MHSFIYIIDLLRFSDWNVQLAFTINKTTWQCKIYLSCSSRLSITSNDPLFSIHCSLPRLKAPYIERFGTFGWQNLEHIHNLVELGTYTQFGNVSSLLSPALMIGFFCPILEVGKKKLFILLSTESVDSYVSFLAHQWTLPLRLFATKGCSGLDYLIQMT